MFFNIFISTDICASEFLKYDCQSFSKQNTNVNPNQTNLSSSERHFSWGKSKPYCHGSWEAKYKSKDKCNIYCLYSNNLERKKYEEEFIKK